MRPLKLAAAAVATVCVAAVVITAGVHDEQAGDAAAKRTLRVLRPAHASLPGKPGTVIGVYVPGVPDSIVPVARFEAITGARPREVLYYSGWGEPFRSSFAHSVASAGAVPLIQIEPKRISLTAIAGGTYDGYLISYASAVRAYGRAVIVSFGHEMNGDWYSWGYRQTSPANFIAAWRHVVDVFRAQGADNVTWLWTVNSLAGGGTGTKISGPAAWWPGNAYVTWAGIDGYYYRPDETFASLFGPAVRDIRKVTRAPILIAETGAAPQAGKAAKIAALFAGVKASHLLGLVWFDARGHRDWRIETDPAALAAFHKAAEAYR